MESELLSLRPGSIVNDHLQHLPDMPAVEHYIGMALDALGLDLSDPHLQDTPRRIAKLYREMLTGGPDFAVTTFPHEGGDHDSIIIADIPVVSFCSHHFLPFTGKAHIAYRPNGMIAGLSKFARIVQHFARRPQVQERLTAQIADAIIDTIDPDGVAVVIEASHACMELRGAAAVGSLTVTKATRGRGVDTAVLDPYITRNR